MFSILAKSKGKMEVMWKSLCSAEMEPGLIFSNIKDKVFMSSDDIVLTLPSSAATG